MESTQKTLNRAEAAEFIGVKRVTLWRWEKQQAGPRFQRLGKKKTIYHLADLESWLAEQWVDPEADTEAASTDEQE